MIRFSGGMRSSLIIGGQGIRSRKLRTLLSMISLFLGVLAVVVVQAAADTARRAALAQSELNQGRDGTVMLFVPPERDGMAIALDTVRGRSDAVAVLNTGAVIGEPRVRPVNPGGGPFDNAGPGPGYAPQEGLVCRPDGSCVKFSGPAGTAGQAAGQAIALTVVAVSGDVLPFRPYRLLAGRWLDFASPPALAPGIVVNREAAKGFARYQVPAQMHLDGATADPTPRMIGVVDDGAGQPIGYVRADELLNWQPLTGPVAGGDTAVAGFRPRGPGDVPETGYRYGGVQVLMSPSARDVERVLRARLVAGGIPAEHLHSEVIDAKRQIATQLSVMRWIFLGIAALVLLIGVAGILNVGLATVGERVEEFALRRAVGTPRSLLAAIVLAETLLTGLFTAAAAIGTGALAVRVAARLLASHVVLGHLEFPWQAGFAGIVAGLVAGLLGGLIPALRAARIPIASIMRA